MFNNFFNNLTLEDVLRWTRTGIQFIAGTTFGSGLMSGTQWQLLVGAIAAAISFLWTLKANTVTAKVAEINKSDEVARVVPSEEATPSVVQAAKPIP